MTSPRTSFYDIISRSVEHTVDYVVYRVTSVRYDDENHHPNSAGPFPSHTHVRTYVQSHFCFLSYMF